MGNGRCAQCDANQFTRARRWRTGDRGGKRPERRVMKRSLRDALDGTWRNTRFNLTVEIDTQTGDYHRRRKGYPEQRFPWRFVHENQNQIEFFKGDVLVKAHVTDTGFLLMRSGGWNLAFSYYHEGRRFLTCPTCFGKTPFDQDECAHCWFEFTAA